MGKVSNIAKDGREETLLKRLEKTERRKRGGDQKNFRRGKNVMIEV